MASDRELKKLYEEITALKKIVRGMHRMGTVQEVENGRHIIKLQPSDVGEGEEDTTPWVRSGHGGAMSEDRQYVKGETVHLFCAGGSMEHAMILPGGFSDNHPQDKNSKKDNSTRRWRKPPQEGEGQQQGQGSAKGSGGGSGQYGAKPQQGEKWKDDDKDHQETTTHDKRWHKIGDTEYTVTADGGEMKHGDRKVKVDKDSSTLSVGDTSVTVKAGKITIKGADIVLEGKVHLGGEGGKPLGVQGSTDTRGDALIGSLATKVTAV